MIYPGIRSEIGSAIRTAHDRLVSTASLEAQLTSFFGSGVKGAWYERSRAATRYQESTGITLASAAGNPVGLGLSLDQGGGRGPNLVIGGDFPGPAVNPAWVPNAAVSQAVVAGELELTATASAAQETVQSITLVAGRLYQVLGTFRAAAGNAVIRSARVQITAGGTNQISVEASANGVVQQLGRFFVATSASTPQIKCAVANNGAWGGVGDKAYFDNIGVMEVPGNYQMQASAGLRPLYQTGPQRLVFDGFDDVFNTAFASALGAACTVGRAIPGTGAVITSGVNIGTSFADSVTASALLIADRALTAGEAALWSAYLNQQAQL